MDLNALKKFAQGMRRDLVTQMDSRIQYVLSSDDEYLRAHSAEKKKIAELEKSKGREELVEEAAYLWFNRLAAFRYMDSRGYTSPRIVSPRPQESQPELLADIKQGKIPQELSSRKAQFDAILSGKIKVVQPDREVYKEALLGACNAWASRMPWLFAKVDDWASLLLPQDLLSEDSLVSRMVVGLSDEDCAEGVEIIGWLYQFYISEKKDEVFALLKKNVKISKDNIPAATQLFTPHWIVRFMVENSLGRLWLLNRPDSRLKDRMKYFVESDPEPEFLKVKDPTELKCLDPCCGSGHILAYFFELLYAIYEEEGYAPQEIPSLILTKNIYGIDIDERAAELAAFTLAMVAREKDKRFFERDVAPNVIAMRDARVDLRKLGVRLSPDLQESVELLKEGRNYGSLIPVPAGAAGEIEEIESGIDGHRFDDLFGNAELDELRAAFRILEYLEPRYQVVVTNPPYMGGKSMNDLIKAFISDKYCDSKADLFAAFIERGLAFLIPRGFLANINLPSWLFLSAFEELRKKIIENSSIEVMLHMGRGIFGIDWGSVAFVINKCYIPSKRGIFFRLHKSNFQYIHYSRIEQLFSDSNSNHNYRFNFDFYNDVGESLENKNAVEGAGERIYYNPKVSDFMSIPGYPFAYWASSSVIDAFSKYPAIGTKMYLQPGLQTSCNAKFVRFWHEVNLDDIGFHCKTNSDSVTINRKWFPYNKGGDFRKWYGNNEHIVNWKNNGEEIKKYVSDKYPYLKGNIDYVVKDRGYYFRKGITWSFVSSTNFSVRLSLPGSLFDVGGSTLFPPDDLIIGVTALLCSKVVHYILKFLNPTLNFQVGNIATIPLNEEIGQRSDITSLATNAISISKADWDLRETSWNFRRSPLLTDYTKSRLEENVSDTVVDWSWPTVFSKESRVNLGFQCDVFKKCWANHFFELHANELELNRLFIHLYRLTEDLTPDVDFSDITILKEELNTDALTLGKIEFDEASIARQFISYGVGCLMGRYSTEKDSLVLASCGSGLDDFLTIVPEALFLPDADGILPLTSEDDFVNDLPTAFKSWLRFISGNNYDINLRWIEDRIKTDLRNYFCRIFYKEHIKTYNSRPIYWMVSSPTGAFKALFYIQRYTKDTVGKILNNYVRPYKSKLAQKISTIESLIDSSNSSATEKTKAKKRLALLEKQQNEIENWEKEHLYSIAFKRIDLDLDDGVKVNYRKLEAILEPIKQLETKEEDD